MIRKSEHTEYIDKYLSQELTGDELRAFNAELIAHPELEEDIKLHMEIEQAIQEKEISSLRQKLQAISSVHKVDENEFVMQEMQDYSFELSEDLLSSFTGLTQPVSNSDLTAFVQGLPILHLAQHKIAEKENIHQFYKDQKTNAVSSDEEYYMTPQDEAIFAGVQDALNEKDIMDLRANLQQIASNLPSHERSTQEIEEYLNSELNDLEMADFETELQLNLGLAKDVDLYLGVNEAIVEADIMSLRANLENIQSTVASTTRKVEEIDQYLNHELVGEELLSFELELASNPDLVAELSLHKEIDTALLESDVLNLRAKLDGISKEFKEEKRKERSIVARIPKMRIAIGTVAASLILLISIAGLLSRNRNVDEVKLYGQYFESYEAAGIFRSGDVTMDNKINLALAMFNEKDYQYALKAFEDALALDPSNPVGNFYAGMAYQETGQYEKALRSYQCVIQLGNNLFVEQSEWYTGLCYLQTDDKKKAYDKFKKIAESNSYYSQKAEAILKEINYLE